MKNIKEFTPKDMVNILRENYEKQNFKVDTSSDKFLPARVPIYCINDEDGENIEEKIIDFTIDKEITGQKFFPTEEIEGVKIKESSTVKFYQYYFPTAKIYFAFPFYVNINKGFADFKKTCIKNGIGLIRVNEDLKVEEIANSIPLFNQICVELEIEDQKKKNKLEYHLRNCLHFFIYYPKPIFRRRAITGKAKERMSYILIDKLVELKNIHYKDELIEFSNSYRKEFRLDFEIAQKSITGLWDKYLGLKYPDIQNRAENILQQDKNYREHFVHQYQVFLIGSYILDSFYFDVAEEFEQKYCCKIEDVWLAASTFHDFSYGLQMFDSWLMDFFVEILRIKNSLTKKNMNFLNLDTAMIREALYDQINKIVNHLCEYSKKTTIENISKRFFYEKAVRDRNHGVLSAITLMKLFEDTDENEKIIKEVGIIEAATAIACHDEDIWEALCGCKGFRRSHLDLPIKEEDCIIKCGRKDLLWTSKTIKIIEECLSYDTKKKNALDMTCESWEREIMQKRIISDVKFKENPILFLLIFCDTIQDEGRVSGMDDFGLKDRSIIENINILSNVGNNEIIINLKSESEFVEKKEAEIERLAWILNDVRFMVSINQHPMKKMNGGGD